MGHVMLSMLWWVFIWLLLSGNFTKVSWHRGQIYLFLNAFLLWTKRLSASSKTLEHSKHLFSSIDSFLAFIKMLWTILFATSSLFSPKEESKSSWFEEFLFFINSTLTLIDSSLTWLSKPLIAWIPELICSLVFDEDLQPEEDFLKPQRDFLVSKFRIFGECFPAWSSYSFKLSKIMLQTLHFHCSSERLVAFPWLKNSESLSAYQSES